MENNNKKCITFKNILDKSSVSQKLYDASSKYYIINDNKFN